MKTLEKIVNNTQNTTQALENLVKASDAAFLSLQNVVEVIRVNNEKEKLEAVMGETNQNKKTPLKKI